jgi:hypothetical protein
MFLEFADDLPARSRGQRKENSAIKAVIEQLDMSIAKCEVRAPGVKAPVMTSIVADAPDAGSKPTED